MSDAGGRFYLCLCAGLVAGLIALAAVPAPAFVGALAIGASVAVVALAISAVAGLMHGDAPVRERRRKRRD